jgi:hypothetical protein
MAVRIRPATVDDAPGLIALWREVNLKFSENEVADELAAVLTRDPDIVLLGEDRHGLAGCRKVNLLIEPTNSEIVPFYRRLGYSTDELIFMEKFLSGPGS